MNKPEKARFISAVIDYSNHKYMKLVPVLVRYFVPHIGIKVRVLSSAMFRKVLHKFGLTEKIVTLSFDNISITN